MGRRDQTVGERSEVLVSGMKRNMSKLTYTHHSLLTPTHTQSEDEIMDLKGNLLLPPAKPTAAASTPAEQEAVHNSLKMLGI